MYRIRDWNRHFETAESRKLKRMVWVPVPNKTDGEGYTALVDHPNGAAHLGAWYAILEAASKQNPRGSLPSGIPQTIGGICQSLSRISRLPSRIFEEVLPRLVEIGWLENQQDTATLAESAGVPGESAGVPGIHNKILHDNTEQDKEPFALSSAQPCLVRPDVPTFEDFWAVWWNKTAKVEAKKAWGPAAHRYGAAFLIAAVTTDRTRFESLEDWVWRSKIHAATWLRGSRWEDEVPPSVQARRLTPLEQLQKEAEIERHRA